MSSDSSTSPTAQKGGRSPLDRDNRKVRQILQAARALFMEQPYHAVSMDAVARGADVSKATLYAHFAGKDLLFASLIEDECKTIADAIWTIPEDVSDIEVALHVIAHNFVRVFTSRHGLALFRTVISEAPRLPELGRIFFESGPRLVVERLTAFLSQADADGLLVVPRPALSATQFLSLVRGDLHLDALLGLPAPAADEVAELTDGGIELFLAGHRSAR